MMSSKPLFKDIGISNKIISIPVSSRPWQYANKYIEPPPDYEFILFNGFWSVSGIWEDNQVWNDGE